MSAIPDILHAILARKAEEVAERRAQLSASELSQRIEKLPPPRQSSKPK